MDRAVWETQYKKQCYKPVMQNYAESLLKHLAEHAEEVHKEFVGQLDAFLQSLCLLQEHKKLGEIQTISISFPYTLLDSGSPILLFEVYSETAPFMERAVLSREFSVSWMFSGWDNMLKELKEEAGRQGMNSVIRMPYIRSQAWGGARILLSIFSGIIKYHLYGLEEMRSFQELKKAEEFSLTFGEYMDWQRTIFRLRPELDIFFCEKDTDLRFCSFNDVWYEEKEFDALVLDDCRFEQCTFKNCRFSEVSFRDARFLGCVFHDCRFENVILNGARFDGCSLERVRMEGIRTNSFSKDNTAIEMPQGMTEWLGCFWGGVTLIKSDFSAGRFRGCQMEQIHTEECRLPESFYSEQ